MNIIMRLIITNYLDDIGNVTIDTCRVYQTNCDDEHFTNIVLENRNLLGGEFLYTNYLYVLMDNESVEDTTNFYASISFRTRMRGNDTIYQVYLVTKENGINDDLLKDFLCNVLGNLSLDDNIRIAFSSDHLEITYSISSDEHINLCVENMFEELGLNN